MANLHDAVAAVALLRPEFCRTIPAKIAVTTHGPQAGQLKMTASKGKTDAGSHSVIVEIDEESIRSFIIERLAQLPIRGGTTGRRIRRGSL